MEISGKIPPVYSNQGVTARKPVQKIDESQPSATKTDSVSLSKEAQELQAARKAALSIPDVDMEKVAKIKAQLKEGTYKVDPQKIAGKMLEETLLTRGD